MLTILTQSHFRAKGLYALITYSIGAIAGIVFILGMCTTNNVFYYYYVIRACLNIILMCLYASKNLYSLLPVLVALEYRVGLVTF
jgi:hypothetical protein